MRTKTLLLTAALTMAGIGYTMAQTVYSVNVVGYVNKTCVGGASGAYTLLANPLNGTNNLLNTILAPGSGVVDGMFALRWDAGTQSFTDPAQYVDGAGWLPDTASIAPGEGFFMFNPGATDVTLTFVGEVLTGSLTNSIATQYNLLANKVPQAIGLEASGLVAADGDYVLFWLPTQGYSDPIQYVEGAGWLPNDPVPDVGQGFFYFNNGAAKNWVRTFTIN